ncbi:MAG: hypothetical protein D6731_21540 [Planctomycetota bacterium]|nr:MAG: hypothetical protein D6731_21540 [Planctomycetota bacterium]
MSLPTWIGAGPPRTGPLPTSKVRLRTSFVEKTLLGISDFLRRGLEEAPERAAILEPRAALLAALALLVGISLSHSLVALALVAVALAALAGLLGLGLGRTLWRVWGVVPLFSAAIALPAVLNVSTPGPTLVELVATPAWLVRIGWPPVLSVTTSGVGVAGLLVLRVGASVSVAALLAGTTPPTRLLSALGALGIPRAFVLVAALTLRYARTLAFTVSDMHLALLSRRVRTVDAKAERAFVGSRMGVVLQRSRATAEEVHMAMLARGFRGDYVPLFPTRVRPRDVLAVLAAIGVGALLASAARAGIP